jgi:DNA-binding transcriptional regulator/RsmH inhibitor MraZ
MANEADGTVNVTLQSTAKSKEPVRFFGTYPGKLSTGTNQVTLPKMFKKAVEEGDEGHLMLLPRPGLAFWQLYTKKALNQLIEDTRVNPKYQEKNVGKIAANTMAKTAIPIEYDTQGRFVVKEFAAKLKGEANDVMFESGHTHIKLWALNDYNAEQAKLKDVEESEEMQKAMSDVLDS